MRCRQDRTYPICNGHRFAPPMMDNSKRIFTLFTTTCLLYIAVSRKPPLPSFPVIRQPETKVERHIFFQTELLRAPDAVISILLYCKATGNPKPSHEFQFRANASSEWKDVGENAKDGKFVARKFGQHRCKASAGQHTAVSPTYTVKVLDVQGEKYATDQEHTSKFGDAKHVTKVPVRIGKPAWLTCPQRTLPKGMHYKWIVYWYRRTRYDKYFWHQKYDVNSKGEDKNAGKYIVNQVTGELVIPKVLESMLVFETPSKPVKIFYGCGLFTLNHEVVVLFQPYKLKKVFSTRSDVAADTQAVKAPSPVTFVKPPYKVDYMLYCLLGVKRATWSKGANNIDSKNAHYRMSRFGGILKILNVSEEDKGTYTCTNEAKKDIVVNVNSYPEWLEMTNRLNMAPNLTYVPHGLTNVRLKCNVKNAKEISWELDGEDIINQNKAELNLDNNLTITIQQIDKQNHGGSVSCTAQNQHGSIKAWKALNVYHRTRFHDAPNGADKKPLRFELPTSGTSKKQKTFTLYYDLELVDFIEVELQQLRNVSEGLWETVGAWNLSEEVEARNTSEPAATGIDPRKITYTASVIADGENGTLTIISYSGNTSEYGSGSWSGLPTKFRVVAKTRGEKTTIFDDEVLSVDVSREPPGWRWWTMVAVVAAVLFALPWCRTLILLVLWQYWKARKKDDQLEDSEEDDSEGSFTDTSKLL